MNLVTALFLVGLAVVNTNGQLTETLTYDDNSICTTNAAGGTSLPKCLGSEAINCFTATITPEPLELIQVSFTYSPFLSETKKLLLLVYNGDPSADPLIRPDYELAIEEVSAGSNTVELTEPILLDSNQFCVGLGVSPADESSLDLKVENQGVAVGENSYLRNGCDPKPQFRSGTNAVDHCINAVVRTAVVDTDGDGVPDSSDDCPESDVQDYIMIEGCNTMVVNDFDPNKSGCTYNDVVLEIADECTDDIGGFDHERFVSATMDYATALKRQMLITRREKTRIVACFPETDSADSDSSGGGSSGASGSSGAGGSSGSHSSDSG